MEESSPRGLEGGRCRLTDQEGAGGGVFSSSNRIVRALPGLNHPVEAARMASSLFLISTNAVEAVFLA